MATTRAVGSGVQARYAVIIVLDGARPDYFQLAPMPHLRWLMQRGTEYTRAFVGQEIANTPPSHATIGTGVFPRRHGVEGFVWTDPRTGQMTRPGDTPAVLTGALEAVMARHHVPSIAQALKERDPRGHVVAVSGHKCYAADAMGTAAADYILCALIYHDRWVAQAIANHRPPPGAINNPHWDVPIPSPSSGFAPAVEQWNLGSENAWTVRYALWAFNRVHYPRVMMINLPETDVTGHFVDSPRPVETDLMKGFDQDLGQIMAAYRRAGILSRTTFLVTADHGMSHVEQRLPFGDLDSAINDAGATKIYIEGDTSAVIGIRELAKAKSVAKNVVSRDAPLIDAVYYKSHSHGRWLYRPAWLDGHLSKTLRDAYLNLVDTTACREGPEVFVVYKPHVTTGDRPVRGYHWVGGHLGPQWDDQHIPLLIAGAGVRHGIRSTFPARLVDIAPTVEALLSLPIGNVDGSVLDDALLHPSRGGAQHQRRVGNWLDPQVKALAQRSK